MALLRDRKLSIFNNQLTVWTTWDDATGRLQRIEVECTSPVPIWVGIYRGGSSQPWREAVFRSPPQAGELESLDESRPFGGGLNNLAQIQIAVEYPWV